MVNYHNANYERNTIYSSSKTFYICKDQAHHIMSWICVEEVGAYSNNFIEKWLFHNGLADLHLGTLLLANHVSVATCCAVFAIVGLVQILHKTICYV